MDRKTNTDQNITPPTVQNKILDKKIFNNKQVYPSS